MNQGTQRVRGRVQSIVYASALLLESITLDFVLLVLVYACLTDTDPVIVPRRHDWKVSMSREEVAIAVGFAHNKSLSPQRDDEGRLSIPMLKGLLDREDLGTAAERAVLRELVEVVRKYDTHQLPETLPTKDAGLVGGWVDVVASTRDDRELIPRMAPVFRRWWDPRVDRLATAAALTEILGKWMDVGAGEVVICQGRASAELRHALMAENGIRVIVETPVGDPTKVASVVIGAGNPTKTRLAESAVDEVIGRSNEAHKWAERKVIPGAVVHRLHYGSESAILPQEFLQEIVAKLALGRRAVPSTHTGV